MNRINGKDVRSNRIPKHINLTLTIQVSLKELSTLIHDEIWLTSEGRTEWPVIIPDLTIEKIQQMMSQKAICSPHYDIDPDDEYYTEVWNNVHKKVKELYRGRR